MEIAEFLPSIITSVHKFIEYDPNYTYGDDMEDDAGDDYGYGEYEDAGAYSDDGDSSWKVRTGRRPSPALAPLKPALARPAVLPSRSCPP